MKDIQSKKSILSTGRRLQDKQVRESAHKRFEPKTPTNKTLGLKSNVSYIKWLLFFNVLDL